MEMYLEPKEMVLSFEINEYFVETVSIIKIYTRTYVRYLSSMVKKIS
jgi:hypothetical protein